MHRAFTAPRGQPQISPSLVSGLLAGALAGACAGGCDVRDEAVRPAVPPRPWTHTSLDTVGQRDDGRPESLASPGIEYVEGHAAGRRRAAAEGLPMLLVFRAGWCRWSAELAKGPLADRGVVTASRRFVCVMIDADRDADTCVEFGVSGFPTVVVLDTAGRERFRATGTGAAGQLAVVMHELLDTSARPARHATGLDDARL
jgi:hypothetical protein